MAQDYPDNAPMVNEDRTVTLPWNGFFQRVQNVVLAAYSSGPTTSRPTRLLWIGRSYFDTTLGKPVYVKSIGPVVWVDGSGAVV